MQNEDTLWKEKQHALMATIPISSNDNFEPFSLLWLDALVNKSKENLQTASKLRLIIPYVQVFETVAECERYINETSIDERLILIVSGRLGQELVPRIHRHRQILSIYIYCLNKNANSEWAKYFPKVRFLLSIGGI